MVSLNGGADEETAQWDDRESKTFSEVLIDECVGVIVLSKDIKKTLIDSWLDVIKLAYVCMLYPIHQHFAAEDYEKR